MPKGFVREENSGHLKHLHGKLVGIAFAVNDPFYAGIDYHLCAYDAGLVRAVKRCTLYGYAKLCRLYYGVLLGMYGIAKLVPCA